MQINREQMKKMLSESDNLLHSAIRKFVVKDYSYVVDGVPNDLVDEMINNGIKKAQHYGISSPEGVATFVFLMFEFGPEFHRHPLIQQQLTNSSIAPELRLASVIEKTTAETWKEVESVLHRQTWFSELRDINKE